MKLVNSDLTADPLSTIDHFRLTSLMNGINFKQLNVILSARYDYEIMTMNVKIANCRRSLHLQ